MSYTPYNWQTGDTITAERLNNMEGGIEIADPFVITLTPTAADLSGTMDKTPAEIDEQFRAGRRILLDIPTFNGVVECSQFIIEGDLYAAHANIVFNPGTGDALLHIYTRTTAQTYGVLAFPLT